MKVYKVYRAWLWRMNIACSCVVLMNVVLRKGFALTSQH